MKKCVALCMATSAVGLDRVLDDATIRDFRVGNLTWSDCARSYMWPNQTSHIGDHSTLSRDAFSASDMSAWYRKSDSKVAMDGKCFPAGDWSFEPDPFCLAMMRNAPGDVQHPDLVAWPCDAGDVQLWVLLARKLRLKIAAFGTGHEFNNRHVPQKVGVAIRTGMMRNITFDLDPHNRFGVASGVVTVGAGLQWRDVLPECQKHDRICESGYSSTVGVVGWFAGGGHSPFGAHLGLGADNVMEAELVSPEGALLRVNANGTAWRQPGEEVWHTSDDTDLFYAIRGGGAFPFGIITQVTYVAQPMPRGMVNVRVYLAQLSPEPLSDADLRAQLGHFHRGIFEWSLEMGSNWTHFSSIVVDHEADCKNSMWQGQCSAWQAYLEMFYVGLSSDAEYGHIHAKLADLANVSGLTLVSNDTAYEGTDFSYIPAHDNNAGLDPSTLAAETAGHAQTVIAVYDKDTMAADATAEMITENVMELRGLGFDVAQVHYKTFPNGFRPAHMKDPGMANSLSPGMIDGVTEYVLAPQYNKTCVGDASIPTWSCVLTNQTMWERMKDVMPRMMENIFNASVNHPQAYYSESFSGLADWKQKYWGDGDTVANLERIKQKFDPELFFWTRQAIGDGLSASCPTADTFPPRRDVSDCWAAMGATTPDGGDDETIPDGGDVETYGELLLGDDSTAAETHGADDGAIATTAASTTTAQGKKCSGVKKALCNNPIFKRFKCCKVCTSGNA